MTSAIRMALAAVLRMNPEVGGREASREATDAVQTAGDARWACDGRSGQTLQVCQTLDQRKPAEKRAVCAKEEHYIGTREW